MSSVITVPSGVFFDDAELGLVRADQVFRSGFTGRRQTLAWPYALWVFTGRTVPYDHAEAGKLRSFLARLRGRVNLFRLPIPGAYNTAGYTGANPTLSGAHAADAPAIQISGPANTLILRDGDYLTINDECKLVTADVVTNGSGQALLPIEPSLRRPAASGLVVEVKSPYILLSSDQQDAARWKLIRPTRHTFNFVATEAYE